MSTPQIMHDIPRADREGPFMSVNASDELTVLRAENAELRARLEELEHALLAEPSGESAWAEQLKEYEALLEEKSEVIRTLHMRIQELQEGVHKPEAQAPATETNESVEQVDKSIEEKRRRLQEDEDAVMQQMRQMELAMARDRADLARQRAEIQRLYKELNHEIESVARDPALRERLSALQRLHGENASRKQGGGSAPGFAAKKSPPAIIKNAAGGLLGRFFGR